MNCRPLPVARFLLAGFLLLLGGSAHADETLTYDPNGNIVTRTLPAGTTTYQYDDLDRLTAETGPARTQTLAYDPNGNRKSDATGTHTYIPNTNRQLTIAGQSVTLDAAGNVIRARNLGFVWNAAGQLIEVRQGSPTGTLLASYTYDYQRRRTRKVISGSGSLHSRTTIYTYDQYDRLSGEFDGAGRPRRTYVWRDAVPLAVIDHYGTSEVAYYLETDHLGSSIAARDQDGTVVWRWTSDAFGATLPNEDADANAFTVTINLRFPGQYFDKESGLHYNHHRYYDPKLGRYMSSDPIGIAGGRNPYVYVDNAPTMYIDPTGELPSAVGGALAGAAMDIGIQLLVNGMRPQCIKWDVVAIAALAGAVNPFSSFNAAASALKAERQFARAAGLREGSRAATRTAQRGDRHNSRSMKEAASWAAVEGGAEATGNLIPDEQHVRFGNPCECR